MSAPEFNPGESVVAFRGPGKDVVLTGVLRFESEHREKVWTCACGVEDPVGSRYQPGDSEPCVHCYDGTARVVSRSTVTAYTLHQYPGEPKPRLREHSLYPIDKVEVIRGRLNDSGTPVQRPTLEIV